MEEQKKSDASLTDVERLVLELSTVRFANQEPLRSRMFVLHNDWLKTESRFIKRWENVMSRCGSCIRRVQTNVLKHYYDAIWSKDSGLELWKVDGQDGRPLFRLKEVAEKSVVAEAEMKQGSEADLKQPPKKAATKRRGRPKKSK